MKQNKCKIEIIRGNNGKTVYLNGQDISAGCSGIKTEVPADGTATVTLTFDADELHIIKNDN